MELEIPDTLTIDYGAFMGPNGATVTPGSVYRETANGVINIIPKSPKLFNGIILDILKNYAVKTYPCFMDTLMPLSGAKLTPESHVTRDDNEVVVGISLLFTFTYAEAVYPFSFKLLLDVPSRKIVVCVAGQQYEGEDALYAFFFEQVYAVVTSVERA